MKTTVHGLLRLVLCSAAFSGAGTTASAQIVVNGGFEDIPLNDPVHSAGESFGGWTVGLGYAGVTYEEPGTAYAGLLSLGLVPASSVYQDIPTVPGVVYEVSFWQSFYGGSMLPMFCVRWDDEAVYGEASRNAWGQARHTFTAARATTRLSLGTINTDLSYDEVSVVPVFPRLTIARTAEARFELSWATNHVGYSVESTAALPAVAWVPVPESVTLSGDHFTVVVSGGEQARYFRLRKVP
jgi:hypothetical protein